MRVCERLVGLGAVNVLGIEDVADGPLRVHVATRGPRVLCHGCGGGARVKDHAVVELVDLAAFGRATRLLWHKVRWQCPSVSCPVSSWTEQDRAIAAPRVLMTDRAGRWVTEQVGRRARTVSELAKELGCDWHTVNDAVILYGEALLAADTERIGAVSALGLDETLFVRRGQWHVQHWATSIVDVSRGQLLDMVPGRDSTKPCEWIAARGDAWRAGVQWATLDMSGPYRKVFDTMLPDAVQIADPFHVVKLANGAVDECRRRVQNETCGHRGRKDDAMFRARRLLTKGHERLDERGNTRLDGLLKAGDPKGEVRMAWHAKEMLRSIWDYHDYDTALEFIETLIEDFQDVDTCPVEINRLGRTLQRWKEHIAAWHKAHVTNAPTEAINNLIKRVKRGAFGFTNFANYRIRALLYAGRPNWDLLATVTPR
jgi:transposase